MMINIAPNNPTLYNFLNPNNQATPQINTVQNQQVSALSFPQTPNTGMNPLSFNGASLVNTSGNSVFANQIPPNGTNPMFATPASNTGMSNGLGFDPNAITTGFEQQANQFLAQIPPSSPTGAGTTGIPANAPRQASIPSLVPQGSNTIVLTAGAIEKLQQGQNPTGATAEDPESEEALVARTKKLEDELKEAKGAFGTSETLEKIASLEEELARLKDTKNQTNLTERLKGLEAQIASLKEKKEAPKTPVAKKPPVPKIVAKAPAKTNPPKTT
jgi:hypothetical protein